MSTASPHARTGDSSLEHCFTNIFALTDCNGIHYKKYALKVEREYHNILEDPVIKSFVLCQKNNVMCAWVRSKRESSERIDPCSSSKFNRELWVFWYGTGDFPNAESCILPELCEVDRGNWRQGLSYETRTVLFRALHNVVERCLLSKGFVRIGKCFVQPYRHNCNQDYAQYSVSFSFFLHGESTVCTSLDLRRHPLVRRLSPRHILSCSRKQTTIPVILSPYGISAELVGFCSEHKSTEKITEEWETWSSFYPLRPALDQDNGDNETFGLPQFTTSTSSGQGVRTHGQQRFNVPRDKQSLFNRSIQKGSDSSPSFVDVIVGNFRLRYPSCLVLLAETHHSSTKGVDSMPDGHSQVPSGSSSQTSRLPQFVCTLPSESRTSSVAEEPTLWRLPCDKTWESLYSRSTETLPTGFKLPLHSSLFFDVHRICLAERALCLSNAEYLSPRKRFRRNKDCFKKFENENLDSSHQNDALTNQSCDRPMDLTCCCSRSVISQQTTGSCTFHHSGSGARRALRDIINESDQISERPQQLVTRSSPFSVPHDPLMPTLSPQQPTSLPSSYPGGNWTKAGNESAQACKLEPSVSHMVSKTVVPPALSSASTSVGNVPEVEGIPQKSLSAQLPSGLVLADRCRPPNVATDSSYAKAVAVISVVKSSHENSWLTELSSKDNCFNDGKKPVLQLDPADMIDLEHLRSHLPPSVSPPHSGSGEEVAPTDDCHMPPMKRPRCQPRCTTDVLECGQEEMSWQPEVSQAHSSSVLVDHVPITPETPTEYCDSELCDDTQSAVTVADPSGQGAQLPGSAANLFTRTLGFIPHIGMSLASSTGSGHIGPAELALMLPTPPSHDAPQPSPVDGITVTSTAISVTNSVSRSNAAITTGNSESPTHVQPLERIDQAYSGSCYTGHSNAPLIHLAKQSCIQDFSFVPLDLQQDWTFVRPYAAYLGVSSNYQLLRMGSYSPSKGLPHVNLAFDHRAYRPKPPLVQTHTESGTTSRVPWSPSHCTLLPRTHLESISPRSLASPLNQRDPASDKSKQLLPQALSCTSALCSDSALSTSGFLMGSTAHAPDILDEPTERLNNLIESNSIQLNVLLSDSILNLFKDHNFDSCNICECTSSVLGCEIDLYLSNCAPFLNSSGNKTHRSLGSVANGAGGFGAHELVGGSAFAGSNDCKCGFSAVVNQKYVVNGNLFFEDEVEVTNLRLCFGQKPNSLKPYSLPPMYRRSSLCWNASSSSNYGKLNILKQLAQGVYNELFVRQLTGFLTRTDFASPLNNVKENLLEYDNACQLVMASLYEASGIPSAETNTQSIEPCACVHPSYILKTTSKIPESHNDQIRLLSTLRPWLQEAISSTRLLESNYTVDGPLSWKAFHQLAGRGSDETCEPQPVPLLRIGGSDKDHMLISPFAVRDWDRLSLAPLSSQKQLAYAVVLPGCYKELFSSKETEAMAGSSHGLPHDLIGVPYEQRRNWTPGDGKFLGQALVRFFTELSLTYESCRLGQHLPYHQPELSRPETAFIFVDPVKDKVSEDGQSSVFTDIFEVLMEGMDVCGPSETLINRLHSYLTSALSSVLCALHDNGVSIVHRPSRGVPTVKCSEAANLFPRFSHPADDGMQTECSQNSKVTKVVGHSSTNPQNGQGPLTSSLDTSNWSSTGDTYLIIYLLNPFSQVCEANAELRKAVMQSFLECGHQIIASLPNSWQSRASIQFLPIEQVMSDYLGRLRSLSLAVYSSVNRYIEPSLINANRTLTGLGPAAEKESISNEKESFHKRTVHAPPYILGGSKDSGQWDMPPSDPFFRSSVLFVAYCLSQDQQWLLASFTDECGSLLDQTLINISVPSAFFNDIEKRRMQSASTSATASDTNATLFVSPRRVGLARLWDYIINIIRRTSNPWRLVIGRIGRLGHGELKGWNNLLGRKSLQDVNKFFREHCSVCNASASIPAQTNGSTGTKATLHLINCSSNANSCTHELPSLISACLTSLEPQSTFRVYPGDDTWAFGGGGNSAGGGGGGGGAGLSGAAIAGNVTGTISTGVSGTSNGSSASPFSLRTMMIMGSETVNDIPSTTHILVFPTSTSASGLSEHDATELDDVIIGMNFFEWWGTGSTELGDLDASGNAAAAMFDAFDNPSGLEFGLAGLSAAVASAGVNDHCGPVGHTVSSLTDPTDNVLSHADYGGSLNDHRDHDRSAQVGLHGLQSAAMDLDTGLFGASKSSQRRMSDSNPVGLLNTMPHGLSDHPDEVTNLMQQPLAMGYYISTAPTGPLPSWFWAACPHASIQFPVCLKSALHIQTSLVGLDDAAAVGAAAPSSSSGPTPGMTMDRPNHLLDSLSTCDVLRFVLEAYNALSWLTINPTTNDRRSCLPIHVLTLCQLYQAVEAFT